MKRNILIGLGFIIFITVIFILSNKVSDGTKAEKELLTGKHYVRIVIEDYGTIDLELDANIAPITVTNFLDLVNNKFYDGLTFHRIIKGFMMQGGHNSYKEAKNIKGEFTLNGIENNLSHTRGVISMARSDNYNSASSGFFIVHEDSLELDGKYAAFGYVINGIEVVDKICEEAKPINDNGMIEESKQPIIKSIRVISND